MLIYKYYTFIHSLNTMLYNEIGKTGMKVSNLSFGAMGSERTMVYKQ